MCADLLDSMEKEKEALFPSRNSFIGADGIPFTATLKCLISTVESWKALERRLNFLSENLANSVDTHSFTNESYLEDKFGFTTSKGQGHLQTVQEYIQSKRRHAIDFQIQMCKTPFIQDLKTSIHDKSYQELDHQGVELSYGELSEIFKPSTRSQVIEDEHSIERSAKSAILKRAYLLSKSVPRQSNRSKWREASGYQPNMLVAKESGGTLYKGDIVFHYNIQNELQYLIVEENLLLDNVNSEVKIRNLGTSNVLSVPVNNLAKDDGMIAVIPSQLYSLDGDEVHFEDVVLHLIKKLETSATESLYTDADLADIMVSGESTEQVGEGSSTSQNVDFVINTQRKVNKRNVSAPSSSGLQKKL